MNNTSSNTTHVVGIFGSFPVVQHTYDISSCTSAFEFRSHRALLLPLKLPSPTIWILSRLSNRSSLNPKTLLLLNFTSFKFCQISTLASSNASVVCGHVVCAKSKSIGLSYVIKIVLLQLFPLFNSESKLDFNRIGDSPMNYEGDQTRLCIC